MQELETLLNSLVQRDWKPREWTLEFCVWEWII